MRLCHSAANLPQILLDQKLVKRMRTYIKLEMGDFQRMLLVRTVDTLSNARLWEEDRSFTISPASARSDDHPAPSSFTSTGSPLDQASIPSPLNHRDSTITILPANTARVLPVPIADHTLYREVNVSLDEPQRKELSLGTTIRERVQEQENTTQNEPNRDSNLSLSALLPPIRSSHCPRVHNPEDPLSVKVPSVTEKASWSPFANERSSLREAGRQLPVSTFIPSPKLEEVPEGGPSSHDEPEELSSPPFSTRPTISGLEIADTRSIRTTQRTMESTEVHMLDTPSLVLTPRIRTEPPGFKFHRSDDDSSTLRRRKSRLFNFMSRSEKSTPERLPHSLELSFSHCGRYLVMWCRKDATFIIRIEYPFRSGRRFQLDLPKERQSTDRNASNTSIRHLVCYGEAIAALIQIENVSSLFPLRVYCRFLIIQRLGMVVVPSAE
jgi:hypothetical protein